MMSHTHVMLSYITVESLYHMGEQAPQSILDIDLLHKRMYTEAHPDSAEFDVSLGQQGRCLCFTPLTNHSLCHMTSLHKLKVVFSDKQQGAHISKVPVLLCMGHVIDKTGIYLLATAVWSNVRLCLYFTIIIRIQQSCEHKHRGLACGATHHPLSAVLMALLSHTLPQDWLLDGWKFEN